jgi:hypothetical protein
MTHDIILIGNPEDPGTQRFIEAYRDAGFAVTIRSEHQTRAVGGTKFHTIVVDEWTGLPNWEERNRAWNERLVAIMRDLSKTVARAFVASEEFKQILHEQAKPKNQPHGPQRKGRGGKLKRW